ncbi:MAG: hypothetical protein R2794_06635 [Chitinophagales bacterium]
MGNTEIAFVLFWLTLSMYLIYKLPIACIPGLDFRQVATAFVFKAILGCANYFVWIYIIGHGDSLRYIHDADIVYGSLKSSPHTYLQLLTRHSLQDVPQQLIPYQHALYIEWHVPEYNMVRLFALLHVFTNGSAWADIVIIALLSTLALCALARTLFPDGISFYGYLLLFFLPSITFWSGGLLKEGPTIILIAGILTLLLRSEKKPLLLLWSIPLMILLYGVRDYLLLLLVPNCILYLFARSRPKQALWIFGGGTFLTCVVIFLADTTSARLDLPAELTHQQSYFLTADPDPDYAFHALEPSYRDILSHVPAAVNNVLFRPNILHSDNVFRVYQSIELLLLLALFAWLLKRTRKISCHPFGLLLLFLAVELLLLYGLLVTDADTLSRYRTLPVFLLLLGMLFRMEKAKTPDKQGNHII